MSARWDPTLYALFAEERGRPFHELVARVGTEPRRVVDLGCGDGRLTRTLRKRWPHAEILGIDRSPEMIEQAEPEPPHLRFETADLTTWEAETPPDLILSNAALHWASDHQLLFPRLVARLAPGGTLAVQMPFNHDAPSHRAVRETAARSPWKARLAGLGAVNVLPPDRYVTLLRDSCIVDVWTTTYHHQLRATDDVLRWLQGTTLRPYLARLDDEDEERFLAALRLALARAYPVQDDHVIFPFTRLFLVAHRHE